MSKESSKADQLSGPCETCGKNTPYHTVKEPWRWFCHPHWHAAERTQTDTCPFCGKPGLEPQFDGHQTYVTCHNDKCNFDALYGDGDNREAFKAKLQSMASSAPKETSKDG